MHFKPSFVEAIKTLLRVLQVVRRCVELVNSGRGGTIFDFVIATKGIATEEEVAEGLSFPEAVRWLVAEAGLPASAYYGCGPA